LEEEDKLAQYIGMPFMFLGMIVGMIGFWQSNHGPLVSKIISLLLGNLFGMLAGGLLGAGVGFGVRKITNLSKKRGDLDNDN